MIRFLTDCLCQPAVWKREREQKNSGRAICLTFSGLEDLDLDLARSVDGSSSLTEEESSFSAGRNCRASRVRQLSSGDDVVTASVNDRSGSCWPDCCCLVDPEMHFKKRDKQNKKYEVHSGRWHAPMI